MNKNATVADLLNIPRTDEVTKQVSLLSGNPLDSLRGISAKTFRLYDYVAGKYKGYDAQIANYRDNNGLTTAQHIRYGDKKFGWVGRDKNIKIQLFGQHLGSQGTLIICEGEIDAMSIQQILNKNRAAQKFVSASIPDGAQSATRSCKDNLSWIMGFNRVVIFLDNDAPGRKAATELAELIGHTSCIASGFAFKDANEALVAGDEAAVLAAINNASRHRPASIIHAPDLLDAVLNPKDRTGLPFPWEGWNKLTNGMRPGQLFMLSGGTGIGKSLFTRSIALHLAKIGIKVANLQYEEDCVTSLERMLSEELGFNPAFHLDTLDQRKRRDPDLIKEAMDKFAHNIFLADKFGSEEFDDFVAAVKHYVLAEGCRVVVLDHFSLLADGIALTTDQRRAIDRCIKNLKELCIEFKFTMIVVCHLSKTANGKSAECGGEPEINDLRGSLSLGQIPDFVVMLQRNPRATDWVEANTTTCILKKNRIDGRVGELCRLHYLDSCRFHEINT